MVKNKVENNPDQIDCFYQLIDGLYQDWNESVSDNHCTERFVFKRAIARQVMKMQTLYLIILIVPIN